MRQVHCRSRRWYSRACLLTLGWLAPAPAKGQELGTTPASPPPSASAAKGTDAFGSEATGETAKSGTTAQPSLGLSPELPHWSDAAPTEPAAAPPASGVEFHGYMRVPFRVGFGQRPDPSPGRARTQLHSPPQVPDYNYTNWTYTNNIPTPWTELRLSYGTTRARGTVVVAAYNLTDAGWRDPSAQLGIHQAWVTLNFPDIFGPALELEWNVGAFSNRYGAAGKYDAGKYDTYLFGRTHTAGETLTATAPLGEWVLMLEHGIGAKLQRPPDGGDPNHPFPTASTLVHHAHFGARFRWLQAGLHYLTSWGQDARATLQSPDGRMTVWGGDLRFSSAAAGDGYLGVSTIGADHVRSLADAIEVVHSFSGGQFMNNYLGPKSDGSGRVTTVLGQYSLSLGQLSRLPEPFYGDGPDLTATLYGMLTLVRSDDSAFDRTRRLKGGAEVSYVPFKYLSGALRFDVVQPNLADNRQSFYVLSPKLVVRTNFLSNEQVTLQYSKYWNGSSVTSSWPTQGAEPDRDVAQILATMWW